MADSDDFEYQLQQEALAAQKAEAEKSGENVGVYTDNDGTVFEWDPVKRAWFPRITEDFVAMYQASYGNYEASDDEKSTNPNSINYPGSSKDELKPPKQISHDNRIIDESEDDEDDDYYYEEASTKAQEKAQQEQGKKRKAEEKEPAWFEENEQHNTKVYVSNLPLDITEDEFVQVMKKCGFIMKDEKGKLKVKLYKDNKGNNKGDGLCSFIKIESVQLALDLLDGSDVREHEIRVERAEFELKGEYNPSLRPKKKKRKRKDMEKQKRKMEKLFDWRPDRIETERNPCEKVVIIKNMFDPEMFTKDPKLILEYRKDVRDECEERCGNVKKVDIYDLHPEGVAKVTFNEFHSSDKCIELMNGRFFAGRRLEAAFWDGKSKYVVKETEEEIENRLKKWDEFLEGDSE